MNDEQKKMRPLLTGHVLDSIYVVNNDFVNFYLIKSATGYVSVDTGADNDKTLQELRKINVDPKEIKAILLTHDHGDHTSSIDTFRAASGGMIDIYARGDMGTHTIRDGEVFVVDGLNILAVAASGHTEDSVSFLVDNKYFFVGDNMSLSEGKPALFNDVYNRDSGVQRQDIDKIINTQAQYYLTSHYGWAAK